MRGVIKMIIVTALSVGLLYLWRHPENLPDSLREKMGPSLSQRLFREIPSVLTIAPSKQATMLEKHAVYGGVTVFHFYADWDSSSRRMAPLLEKMVATHPNLYLRIIPIASWNDATAKKYNVRALPAAFICDKNKEIMARNVGNLQEIERLARVYL